MFVTVSGTKYSCDFMQKINDPNYELIEVRRNEEKVFNFNDDEAAKKENLRLSEINRSEKLKKWVEKSYSNVAYKYYEKMHINDNVDNSNGPKLKIVCNPKKIQFELDDSSIAYHIEGIRNYPFTFLTNDNEIEKSYDITKDGTIGVYDANNFIYKISFNQSKQDEFIDIFTKSKALILGSYEYHMDDLSQIPCLR